MINKTIIILIILFCIYIFLFMYSNNSSEYFVLAKENNSEVINQYDTSYINMIPKGIITAWNGNLETIPKGWVVCDGTNSTPDLRGRFIVSSQKQNKNEKEMSVIDPYDKTNYLKLNEKGEPFYEPNSKGGYNFPQFLKEMTPSHSHNDVITRFPSSIYNIGDDHCYNEYNNNDFSDIAHMSAKVTYNGGVTTGDTNKMYIVDNMKKDIKGNRISILKSYEVGSNISHDNRPKWYALFYIMKT